MEWPWLLRECAAAQCAIVMLRYGLSVRHNNLGCGWVGERLENVPQKKHNEKILAVQILSDKKAEENTEGREEESVEAN